MEHRSQTADMLKGIAILLMIQVHIVELFASNYLYSSNMGKILLFLGGPPVAPVFMIIFGYFMLSPQKTILQLVRRGVGIFSLGMLLNLALNFNLILSVYQKKIQADIWPYIFGVDILQFAGLSLIIIALLKNTFQKHLSIMFGMILLSVFLGKLLLQYIPENNTLLYVSSYFYGSTYWSYFPLFPWIAYPLSGIAFYQLQQSMDLNFLKLPKIRIIAGSITLLLLIITMQFAFSITSNLSLYYHHGALFFLWVILFCMFYTLLIQPINQLLEKTIIIRYIKWLGKNVTLIYVIQWIIIGNIATEIYKTVSCPIYLAYWFIGIVVALSGISYLVLFLKKQWAKINHYYS